MVGGFVEGKEGGDVVGWGGEDECMLLWGCWEEEWGRRVVGGDGEGCIVEE